MISLEDFMENNKDPNSDSRFSEKQRLKIYIRDKGLCQIKDKCDGKKKLAWNNWHADHKEPISKGGKTTVENGQVSCPACNLAKSDKII